MNPTPAAAMPELLRCPFCGADPSIEKCEGNVDEIRWSVGCTTEGCHAYVSYLTHQRIADAITAWNTRSYAHLPLPCVKQSWSLARECSRESKVVPYDVAERLEVDNTGLRAELREAVDMLRELQRAIHMARLDAEEIENLRWGYDGDCGAVRRADSICDVLDAAIEKSNPLLHRLTRQPEAGR